MMAEAPRAGWPAHAVRAHHHRGPADALPSPAPTTPDPNKSHLEMARFEPRRLGPGGAGRLVRGLGRPRWRADPGADLRHALDGQRRGLPPRLPARDAAGVPRGA